MNWWQTKIVFLLFLLLVLSFAELKLGKVSIQTSEIFKLLINPNNSPNSLIINQYRLPRLISALLVGYGLAISGLLLQNLFDNPLAGPYILGISSGAGFGVAVFLMAYPFIQHYLFIQALGMATFGFLGALLVVFILILLFFRTSNLLTILLLGVMISGIFTAIVNILQFFTQADTLKKYVIWTMGSIEVLSYSKLIILFVILVVISIFLTINHQKLDAIYLSELSQTIGLNYNQFVIYLLLINGLVIGVITAFAGPIAFIGIISPHLARLLSKSALNRFLMPITALVGMNLLLFSDILAHILLWNATLPINTITSLIGIPIIIYVILSNKNFYF